MGYLFTPWLFNVFDVQLESPAAVVFVDLKGEDQVYIGGDVLVPVPQPEGNCIIGDAPI